jgi:hypothetical protein
MARVALIACGAEKLGHPSPARDLYIGPLFRACRRWVDLRSSVYPVWGILSAKHGVLLPDQVIEPYEATLDGGAAAWAVSTGAAVRARWGADVIYTVLASERYVSALRDLPFVEDKFEHWRSRKREISSARWGIGQLLSILSIENDVLSARTDAERTAALARLGEFWSSRPRSAARDAV